MTLYESIRAKSGIISAYAITLGLFVLVSFPSVFESSPFPQANAQVLMQAELEKHSQEVSEQAVEILSGKPARLVIPSLGIDMQVVDGSYNPETGEWDLGRSTIHFALPSIVNNNHEGTTLIYGHNFEEIFGQLERLPANAQVTVYTDNNLQFDYTYTEARDLQPNDTTIFDYRGPPTLTLQTCTGNWNELRRMYSFTLDEVTEL